MPELRRSRTVLITVAVLTAIVAVAVVALIPREFPDAVLSQERLPDASVRMRLVVDSIDPARGIMRLRLAASPSDKPLPPEGLSIITNIDTVSSVRLEPGERSSEATAEVPLEAGDLAAYPFDHYRASITIQVVAGDGQTRRPDDELKLELLALDSSVGFDIEGDGRYTDDEGMQLDFQIQRPGPIVFWVSVMMAIFWLLALAVLSVTALVVMGLREWESRHLAWLGAMIFAFASFRASAPGTPPVGVYLDYAAFFWAEAIVALSLMALVIYYLIGLRDRPRSTSS